MIDLQRETPLSIKDVARKLSVTRKTVYLWAYLGVRGRVLETVKVGGKRLTTAEALQRFTEQANEHTTIVFQSQQQSEFDARQRAALELLAKM